MHLTHGAHKTRWGLEAGVRGGEKGGRGEEEVNDAHNQIIGSRGSLLDSLSPYATRP